MHKIFFSKAVYTSFWLLLAVLNSPLSAGNETISRRIAWKPLPNAGGYLVELREKDGATLWQKETEAPEFTLVLAEGDYEFRIGALNRFGKNPRFSRWLPLQVRLAKPPVVQTEPLAAPPPEAKVTLYGSHFSRDLKIFLQHGNQDIPIENRIRKSDSELEFTIPPNLPPGNYHLVLENPLGRRSIVENYLKIPENRKVVEGGRPAVLWRSAVLPGWGQLHAGNKIKGYAVATAFAAAAGFYIYSEINFFAKEDSYQNLRGDVYDPAFRKKLFEAKDSYAAAADLQNIAVFTVAGVYALNLLDAALFNGPYSKANLQAYGAAQPTRLSLAFAGDGVSLTIRHQLP